MLWYSGVLPGTMLVEQEGMVFSLHLGDFLGRLEFCLLSHQLIHGVAVVNKLDVSPNEPNTLISRQ